ncbi:hypothetical protein OF83DRAFT_756429 [Amylostereum chailletii]|nr:hypothetical protein OF83DRAFT_756429 [Amylostereum chailletii]
MLILLLALHVADRLDQRAYTQHVLLVFETRVVVHKCWYAYGNHLTTGVERRTRSLLLSSITHHNLVIAWRSREDIVTVSTPPRKISRIPPNVHVTVFLHPHLFLPFLTSLTLWNTCVRMFPSAPPYWYGVKVGYLSDLCMIHLVLPWSFQPSVGQR